MIEKLKYWVAQEVSHYQIIKIVFCLSYFLGHSLVLQATWPKRFIAVESCVLVIRVCSEVAQAFYFRELLLNEVLCVAC